MKDSKTIRSIFFFHKAKFLFLIRQTDSVLR